MIRLPKNSRPENHRINHEVIRLSAYLQAESVTDRALEYLKSDNTLEDRALVAMCLQFLSHDWTAEQRFEILKFYEEVANQQDVGTLPLYISNVTRDFAKSLSDEDVRAILEQGHVWRNAALAAIYKLKRPVDDETADSLTLAWIESCVRILRSVTFSGVCEPASSRCWQRPRIPESASYLRSLWRSEPERRAVIAMALSVQPEGDNWDYLVRSLNILDDQAAEEVVKALRNVRVATDDPMALRQLILLGCRAEKSGDEFENVEQLLEHWTGMQRPEGGSHSMKPWQKWYSKTYPDRAPAILPKGGSSRWDFDQLLTFLDGEKGRVGDPAERSRGVQESQVQPVSSLW